MALILQASRANTAARISNDFLSLQEPSHFDQTQRDHHHERKTFAPNASQSEFESKLNEKNPRSQASGLCPSTDTVEQSI